MSGATTGGQVEGALMRLAREHIAVAEPIVFFLGFAEGIPLLSWLVPSSGLFLGIGALHGNVGGAFWRLWLSASAGAVLGDLLIYALGRVCKEQILGWRLLAARKDWLDRAAVLFARWGILAVLGGKFLGAIRPLIPMFAGMARMPIVIFLLASLISSAAWAGAFLAPGYGLGRQLAR